MNLCEFYPDDKELNESGPFCWKGSEVTGKPCTGEDAKKCIWAKQVEIDKEN